MFAYTDFPFCRLQCHCSSWILQCPPVVRTTLTTMVNDPRNQNSTKYKNIYEREKGTLIEDTAIAFDETNEAFIEVETSFPYKRTIPKYPHHHFSLLSAFTMREREREKTQTSKETTSHQIQSIYYCNLFLYWWVW